MCAQIMNIGSIFANIFNEYPLTGRKSASKSGSSQTNICLASHISQLDSWLSEKLKIPASSKTNELGVDDGRLGPSKAIFDIADDDTPMVKVGKDHLTVQSQSAFSTIKANCCVFAGKWMYEVQLRSKGVMQIGWCSGKCRFTQDTGVGDTKYSYGLDGSKQRIWHVYTHKYGPYWRSGDIFGVCLNMDVGTIEYYRNGLALGEAFRDIEKGPGLALFPAVSLAFNDCLTANFGGAPFRHPVAGYQPLQRPPFQMLERVDFLLQYMANLSRVISRNAPSTSEILLLDESGNPNITSVDTVYMVLAGLLVEKLSDFLKNTYVIEEKIFPYIRSMCVIRSVSDKNCVINPGLPESTLGTFLTLLWTYMDGDEIKLFIKRLLNLLSSIYKETPVDLEYEKQRMIIVVLTCICNHPPTRKFLLEYKFLKKNCLPLFLYIKPPDESALEKLLPDEFIWTEGLVGSKEQYFSACEKLKSCTSVLYTLQKNLLNVLLTNDDCNDRQEPSSRKIFLIKFRQYVIENSVEHRTFLLLQSSITTPTQPAVALSFLCILLDVTKQNFAGELLELVPPHVAPSFFYDGTFKYSHMDRVGGALSHLRKVFRKELVLRLGDGHESITQPDPHVTIRNDMSDIYSAMLLISGNANTTLSVVGRSRSTASPEAAIRPGNVDVYESLCELLDCAIMYYFSVAHKYIVMIADLRDSIAMLSIILAETNECCEDVRRNVEALKLSAQLAESNSSMHDEILNELDARFGQRNSIFAKRSMELARKQAWYRSVALGTQRRNLLCWLLETVFDTLLQASGEGVVFAFVPEVYINVLPILLDTILDFSFHDTREQHDLSGVAKIVAQAAEFLGQHTADTRVILASCKDALLQALGTLTCHRAGVEALENASGACQVAMVRSLLRPYENRAWGQSNWLLLRFWHGEGFAFRESRPPSVWQGGKNPKSLGLFRSRGKNGSHTGLLHHIAPPAPSKYFQALIGRMLTDDEPFSTVFLNSVLSQLNWAFSEFILLLQEIQNVSQRQEQQQVVIETRQLKICSMCFELTVSLMRALEMIISIAPSILQDSTRQNSDLLLGRICQLVSQVLSRVTVPPGCFQHVVDLCLPDLSSITHFSIIAAAIGILVALMGPIEILPDENFIGKLPRVSKVLLTDPSFQIANLEFALGDVKTPVLCITDMPRGNFDPQMRGTNIDSSSNDLRSVNGSNVNGSGREILPDLPVIRFSFGDYPSHVSGDELEQVKNMIESLLVRQSLLSELTIPSDDMLCPICYAKSISATFEPCLHQSCGICIIQHLMNNKTCFYCKTLIARVKGVDGCTIFENTSTPNLSSRAVIPSPSDNNDEAL